MLWFVYKGTQIRIKCHIFFLSAMHKHYHMDSNIFFYPLCSDPDDRLAPRPVLARYCETDGFQNFSLWLVYNTP
jgi:hypothetical protein